MDPIKKRKIDDNGVIIVDTDAFIPYKLNLEDARKIAEPFSHEQLLEIVQNAVLRHPDVLDAVRSIADRDVTLRKLFIRGLGWETTTDGLRAVFSSYGELAEAVVILDKATGKSKGYGFITFKHVDGAVLALKEPSKKIDGRMTVTQLAAAGMSGGSGPGVGSVGEGNNHVDVSARKIYVANVPYDMPAERLLQHFSMYGEIEEGPLGFDKATGKSKGFALFVYKTAEAARASLVDPMKNIDGHQLNCKLAIDGKRGKPPMMGAAGPVGAQQVGNADGIGGTISGGQYGGIGRQYTGFSGPLGAGGGVGGQATPAVGSQAAGLHLGAGGGFGSALVGPYAGGTNSVGPGATGYNRLGISSSGLGGAGGLRGAGDGYGGVRAGLGGSGGGLGGVGGGLGGGPGGVGGGLSDVGSRLSGVGRGPSLFGLPPSSAGTGSGNYQRSAQYSLSSGGYQSQHNQPSGTSSAPRVPPGEMYQGMHPYY
ncbi:UBP1-associated protein 2C-like [Olea europaea var. sylvestris]|uniref:UBP1-associated protein 2C-like n=1 Tax=Olea europaea var. sylvestris TaxID=158386 RepID=UPI000C1D474D|nr:UBP1-associated protein 2C-like [Olea europaea var. sylvestris]XP_022848468.1 UBP1-associated protein 2C-like [Olea europaea var. sylvestris]XP_022848469.1 UBP1-associated protein 2C-like [Olea europaea var. sylvestris]XP_022848470.1 UBP1-associated protein 2C-like [Olea europaea var. sylvestris]XP_022848471.1 UBP1-associated protein 2C-like [Olea europaea var. sylvestris]XP_022848472.1 UBP1-associated protein 2C-like [Olea europaea var. sylvestris]XP_022848473.1 UBP1-associated protein 2C